jgi:DNA helicase-2/ATP-dependent DNA helicase PcrA
MQARESSLTLWQAANECVSQGIFATRAGTAVSGFIQLIEGMRERMQDWTLGNQMQGMIDESRLVDH